MSAAIQLTNGMSTIADPQDLEFLSAYRWVLNNGYAYTYVRECRRTLSMHRLLLGAKPGEEVDHINRDRLDNRRANLRICTRSQNSINIAAPGSASGYRGVFWDGQKRKWRPQITSENRIYHGSRFLSAEDAAREYDRLALILHGTFAVLNFPEAA